MSESTDVSAEARRLLSAGKERVKRAVIDPRTVMQDVLRASPKTPFSKKVFWDALDRPHYAYGIYQAAYNARHQGIDEISAVEFGVAGGNGLVAMEDVADAVTAETGVGVRVFGFDTGAGMPEPVDYRDLPYVWQPGDFPMDVDRLRSRLRSATLVLGDVAETVGGFVDTYEPPPIGFVAFDLDYWSSTVSALRLFDEAIERFLPRVFCYMDDVIGSDVEIHCEFVGELLAIREFNDTHEDRKLAPINALAHKRPVPAIWNDQIWVLHGFTHPLYGTYIPQPRAEVFDLALKA
ncbi:hypothetical protein [Candidatus Neomicrothrix sp.]|uniref:hypothetical protein n=1 Tax=Candidatus Neomicrothrix sp. TaxID=2719034 RepID=UPI002594557B|nr:hypothetical protein [Candidatus Microthrix sp.]HMS47066.1 hypothetical protein [Candidatus Microthrix sp.]